MHNGDPGSPSDQICRWVRDEDGCENTQCRNQFWFNDGDFKSNNFIYCPYCGRRIARLEHAVIVLDDDFNQWSREVNAAIIRDHARKEKP